MQVTQSDQFDLQRLSLPVFVPPRSKPKRSKSLAGKRNCDFGEVLRSLQTQPPTHLPGVFPEDEDIDEEDYEERPISQTFSCHVVTVVFPSGTQTSVIVDEEDQTLRQVRRELEKERPTAGLVFCYKVGPQEVAIAAEQENTLFKDLLMTTNLRASVRDESLCLFLATPKFEESRTTEKADNELMREYVHMWTLSEGDIKDRILLFHQGRVDLYESELVFLSMDGALECRLRLNDIRNLQFLEGEPNTIVLVCSPYTQVPDTAVKFLSDQGTSQFVKYALPYIYAMAGSAQVLETRAAESRATESRHYFVRKVNHYGFKQKRLVWLELLNFKLHISDLSMKNHKIYEMRRLAHFVRRGDQEKKLSILFKEGSNQKDLHLVFSSLEELNEFFAIAEESLMLKLDGKLQIKKTLFFTQQLSNVRRPGKMQRKYSWLSQESTDIVTHMSEFEYLFNVVIDSFMGYDKRIIALNSSAGTLTVLSSEGKSLKQMSFATILRLSNDLEDLRRLTLTDELTGKSVLIFSSVYLKILFCSVIYTVIRPELVVAETQETVNKEELRVFVGTWNLGHCCPDKSSLQEWVKNPELQDVAALGFQESAKSKRAKWLQTLTAYMETNGLKLLSFIPMWEMFLVIFTRKGLNISNLSVTAKPTGIANMIGNKGGCVATFKVQETSFCFLSCHLAARPQHILTRNQNAKDLFSIRFEHLDLDFATEFDYLFWFGDLNYRLDKEYNTAVEMLRSGAYSDLRDCDQLLKEQNANRSFVNFQEGQLNFPPTYRYIRLKNEWSNKRNQTPSWTDRILYRSFREISLLKYEAALNCMASDHRPVSAEFAVKVSPWFVPSTLPRPGEDPLFAVVEFTELDITCEDLAGTTHGQIVFFAPFLQSTPSTPQFGVTGPEIKHSLQEKEIPILTSAVSDFRYLREQRVILVLYLSTKDRTDVAGLASLPLFSLFSSAIQITPSRDPRSTFISDEFLEVEAVLECAGRRVGNVHGKWNFSLCHKSQQDH